MKLFFALLLALPAFAQDMTQVQRLVDSSMAAYFMAHGIPFSDSIKPGQYLKMGNGQIVGADSAAATSPSIPAAAVPTVVEIEKDSTTTRSLTRTLMIRIAGTVAVGISATNNSTVTSIALGGTPLGALVSASPGIKGYTYYLNAATPGTLQVSFSAPTHASIIAVVLWNTSALSTSTSTAGVNDRVFEFLAVDASSPMFSGSLIAQITKQIDGENLAFGRYPITVPGALSSAPMTFVAKAAQ